MRVQSKSIPQAHLSSECWSVQFHGLGYCKTCELRDTPECGGKKIRETRKNSKGYEVPLG